MGAHRITFATAKRELYASQAQAENQENILTYGSAAHAVATHKIVDSGKKTADITKM
jgi:hypothetical protein